MAKDERLLQAIMGIGILAYSNPGYYPADLSKAISILIKLYEEANQGSA